MGLFSVDSKAAFLLFFFLFASIASAQVVNTVPSRVDAISSPQSFDSWHDLLVRVDTAQQVWGWQLNGFLHARNARANAASSDVPALQSQLAQQQSNLFNAYFNGLSTDLSQFNFLQHAFETSILNLRFIYLSRSDASFMPDFESRYAALRDELDALDASRAAYEKELQSISVSAVDRHALLDKSRLHRDQLMQGWVHFQSHYRSFLRALLKE